VSDGVIIGVLDGMGVSDGIGVLVNVGVIVGVRVAVGVKVLVGVADGVNARTAAVAASFVDTPCSVASSALASAVSVA
jgi:hypothetical protein